MLAYLCTSETVWLVLALLCNIDKQGLGFLFLGSQHTYPQIQINKDQFEILVSNVRCLDWFLGVYILSRKVSKYYHNCCNYLYDQACCNYLYDQALIPLWDLWVMWWRGNGVVMVSRGFLGSTIAVQVAAKQTVQRLWRYPTTPHPNFRSPVRSPGHLVTCNPGVITRWPRWPRWPCQIWVNIQAFILETVVYLGFSGSTIALVTSTNTNKQRQMPYSVISNCIYKDL
jgi:hypothetical protein